MAMVKPWDCEAGRSLDYLEGALCSCMPVSGASITVFGMWLVTSGRAVTHPEQVMGMRVCMWVERRMDGMEERKMFRYCQAAGLMVRLP